MSRQVRVAVIGAGIGAAHVEAYCANPTLYQVAVVCDLDAARAGKVAANAGATVETSYDAVLRRDDVELIDICLPPSLHAGARSRWSARCARSSALSRWRRLPAAPLFRSISTATATAWRDCAG
jgi:hypothetical protein